MTTTTDILNIDGTPVFDNRIVKIETYAYNPYANTTLGHNDEIRVPIQQQDLYTLPCESTLYIEGRFTHAPTPPNEAPAFMSSNCAAFLFDEIRYELNGLEIDRCKNVGITTTLKNYVSLTRNASQSLRNASWEFAGGTFLEGNFNFCVPLSMLLGFCEDYKHVVINARHELVLIRARNDKNCVVSSATAEPKIELFKIQWRMPHVALNEVNKLSMLRTLESGRFLSMSFRSWDLYECPLLQSTTKHSWTVKTANQLEKPRYVIFGLQTDKKNNLLRNSSIFDHCNLTNIKLYLNSECYPYGDMNLDFGTNKIALLYDMYARFRKSYYGVDSNDVFVSVQSFAAYVPLVVIDCSRQNEALKSATVDVRIEFECKENVPENTAAYCLILHDRVVEYNPLSNIVHRIV